MTDEHGYKHILVYSAGTIFPYYGNSRAVLNTPCIEGSSVVPSMFGVYREDGKNIDPLPPVTIDFCRGVQGMNILPLYAENEMDREFVRIYEALLEKEKTAFVQWVW